MAEKMFGTDGFRGPVDIDGHPGRINEFTFWELAQEYAYLIQEQANEPGIFVVGSDTRTSSESLRAAACGGLGMAGAEVWDLGVAPTPVIAWVAQEYGTNAIAITASHNRASNNGMKLFEKGGVKPNIDTLRELEDRYHRPVHRANNSSGKYTRRPELSEQYLHTTIEALGAEEVLAGKRVIVDAANGAAYELGPRLYEALGAHVIRFACTDDGTRINQACGAADQEGVKKFLDEYWLLTGNTDDFLGVFSNDGDADRVLAIDNRSRKLDGNYWLKRLAIGQKGIVGTIYTNSALRRAVEESGVIFDQCNNGDSEVTAKLQDLTKKLGPGFTRGGEFTGHMIDLTHLPSGDGLYMGAWLAAQLVQEGKTLADLRDELELWPEKMVNLRVQNGEAEARLSDPLISDTIAQEEEKLKGIGRLVVRPSGTEPVIRLWVEAQEQDLVDEAIHNVREVLQRQTVTS